MDLGETLALSIKVIADWRVISIAVAFLLLVAALRFVGSAYRRRPSPRRRPAASVPAREAGAPAGGSAASRSGAAGRGEEPGDGMVE
jgi:hypothetical protein